MVNKKADMRIQQMTFMILFVFIFFVVAGLFFVSFQLRGLKSGAQDLKKEAAIASIETIANMPELKFDSSTGDCTGLCLDEDKLFVFSSNSNDYAKFWPVSSIKVRKLYPKFSEEIRCPLANCTYYNIFDSQTTNFQEYGTYVSICKKVSEFGRIYEQCSLGILDVGVKVEN